MNLEVFKTVVEIATMLVEVPAACCTPVAAFAAVVAAVYAAAQVRASRTEIGQSNSRILASMSNEQNWTQFTHRGDLPIALPSWAGLDDVGWAWRVLHLNHLNLLRLAYESYERGVMSRSELEGWVLKARFRFQHLWSEEGNEDLVKGRRALRQLLMPEEGFPREFCEWLVSEKIIPPKLISR